jgi:hypothetical protein
MRKEDMLGRTDAELHPSRDEVEHFKFDDLRVLAARKALDIAEEHFTDATGTLRILADKRKGQASFVDKRGRQG